jgi:hypothetical protein
MAKILSILGPDPVSGYPTSHARDVDQFLLAATKWVLSMDSLTH